MKNKGCKKQKILTIICGSIVGFINGFFGGGGGMICVPLLKKCWNIEEKQAHATTLCVILPLCMVSSVVYIQKSSLDLWQLLLITIGAVLGGAIGALLLSKLKAKWVKIIFALVMLIAGVKIIL